MYKLVRIDKFSNRNHAQDVRMKKLYVRIARFPKFISDKIVSISIIYIK